MTAPDKSSVSTLTPQQQMLRRRLSEEVAKSLVRRPASPLEHYAASSARSGDWTICAQPPRLLPASLTQWLPLALRDEGNALFEETRTLNNDHAGQSFRCVEIMLAADADSLDLQARVLAWGEAVARQVNYKLRHRAQTAPAATFFQAHDTFISYIDTVMVHGKDRLYQLVWSAITDLLAYQLFDAMLLGTGHFSFAHEATGRHLPLVQPNGRVVPLEALPRLTRAMNLYGVETTRYLDDVILRPLLAALQQDASLPPLQAQQRQVQEMFADVLEAFPYLVASDRTGQCMFVIPGTTCVASFSFLASDGCAKVSFCDDMDSLQASRDTNFVRAGLEFGYDGSLRPTMHPWRTLDKVFGADAACTLAYWLLRQIHGQLVQEYLRIEDYYLHPVESVDASAAEGNMVDDTLVYLAFARNSAEAADVDVDGEAECPVTPVPGGALPQLRRRFFFKLLERCGVVIAQGKGSEIKLLRKAKRPFRLGNHYGNNPAIPAFLANNILKRLEISWEDWQNALLAA